MMVTELSMMNAADDLCMMIGRILMSSSLCRSDVNSIDFS